MKVLILTYYWPPSGGAGVQRWLKFVKYLPDFGITPVVYTHSNGEVPSVDESLTKEIPSEVEVLKTQIWEPYHLYKSFAGKKGEKINSGFLSEKKDKSSFKKNLSVFIRGNFFIPDARKFWIKPSVRYLSKYIEENSIDAIISTGPPHSMHLIGLKLKKKFPKIKWISDFRDPWTNIDFYQELKLTPWADRRHRRFERRVLEFSDHVISVGRTLSEELKELSSNQSVHTITNGYDESDVISDDVSLDAKISIAHIGSFTKSRNPELLLKVISSIRNEMPALIDNLELKLVGKVDFSISEIIQSYGLNDVVRKVPYMPHNKVLVEQKRSHLLLLVVNNTPNAKGIITGKIFEYIASGRPILALAPKDGDLAELIDYTNSGHVFESGDETSLKELLISILNNEYLQPDSINKKEFTRKNLTKKLVELLKS